MPKAKSKNVEAKDRNDMWWGATLVGILYFALLINTAPRTNVGYADGDELLTVAYQGGVAHPPGYPIYILLLSLFLKLPIGEIAFRGHVFSIINHSLSLSFVFVFLWKLISYLQNKDKRLKLVSEKVDRWIVSVFGVLILGGNYLFWIYGQVTEKFSFNSLLISIFLIWIIKIWEKKKNRLIDWGIIGTIGGLMVSHHQSLLLLLPMILIVWYLKFSKKLEKGLKSIGFLILGILIVAGVSTGVLWLFNENKEAQVSWRFEQNWKGLKGHILRKDFAQYDQTTGERGSAYLNSGSEIGPKIINGFPIFIKYSSQYFGWLNVLIVGLGLAFIFVKNKRLFYVYGFGLIISLLFSSYVSNNNFSQLPSIVRQYLMSFVMMGVFIPLGWYFLLIRLKRGIVVVSKNKIVINGLIILVLAGLSYRIYKLYPQADLSNYDFVSRFHKDVLNSLPKDSVLACFGDISCFALLYEQNVNGVREDVAIIPGPYPLVKDKLDKIENLKGFDYQDNPYRLIDYISWNLGNDFRRVFALDFDKENFFQFMGVNYGFSYYIPSGYLIEIDTKIPEKLIEPRYDFSQEVKDSEIPELDLMRKWIDTQIPRLHFLNAAMYVNMGNRDEARKQLNMASDILHKIPEVGKEGVEAEREGIENGIPQEHFDPGVESPKIDEIWEGIDLFYDKQLYGKALVGAIGVLMQDPKNKDARMMIADIYEKGGDWNTALTEYKNIDKYYDDEFVKNKIIELESRVKYGF